MRDAIGGAWIMGIVVTFIVLFASFLAVSINYSKAFKVKNNVVDLIEKNEGVTEQAVDDIYSYLQTEGYILKGSCKNNYTGFDRDGRVTDGSQSLYCVQKHETENAGENGVKKTYYSVEVFFRLDLPIFGEIFTFNVSGETMSIYFAKEDFPIDSE